MTAPWALPTGTVAFLLTAIEGSTRRWESEPDAMQEAMARHDAIVDAAVSAHGGVRPPAQGEGDSIVAAFSRASDAVLAARDAQRAFAVEEWPTSTALRVRMAVHSGEARFVDDGNYAGQAIIRTARLRAIAHGGQVLVSAPARDLTVDQLGDTVTFVDLGEHRLRDLARPERVYQLTDAAIPAEFPALRSLNARPHNLPVQLSSFIGRTDDIATVVSLALANRLVTITGTGGSGKTRLALQAAAELVDHWPDGTWLVELAEVTDPDAVAAAIATALRVQGEIGEGAADALANVVADRRLLVALDNCEHLIERVATVVDRLLRRCPGITVLATSREPLEIGGEVAWRIPPLSVPQTRTDMAVEALSQFDGIRLFLERAQRVRPNFHLTTDTAPVVAEICERLDGIPLAIELAAARVRSLPPERILAGLTDAFRLLTGADRAARPRQQTLEASITWSHDLLTIDEQVLLRRMAVFTGGCTLEDAEVIVADEALRAPMVLDVVDRLVAQSLITLDDRASVARYRMLETVRQYAARNLDGAGEADALRTRHADHYRAMALELGPRLEGRDEHVPLARLVADFDNLRAALDTLAARERWPDLADVCCALAQVWEIVDPPDGGAWLSLALSHTEPDDAAARARLFFARSRLQQGGGNIFAAISDAQEALVAADLAGDEVTAGRAMGWLATAVGLVDPFAADSGFEESIERLRRAADGYGELWIRAAHSRSILCILGDTERGWRLHAEVEPMVTAAGNHFLAAIHDTTAAVGHCIQADYAAGLREVSTAEAALKPIVEAAGIDPALLSRRSLPGALASLAEIWATAARGGRIDYTELDRLIASARAEGFLLAEMNLSFATATSAAMFIGPEAWLQRSDGLAPRARELGLEIFWILAMGSRACAAYDLNDLEQALELLDEVEASAPKWPYYGVARNRRVRGAVRLAQGHVIEAEALAHEALTLSIRYTFRMEAAMSVELLAGIALVSGSSVEAARLYGAVDRLRADLEIEQWSLGDNDRAARDRAILRGSMGDNDFEAAFAEGYALSLDEAAEYARRARGERRRPTHGWESLTPTELQVIEQVRAGLTNPQIAEKLLMSRETVKTHLSHVFTKLGVRSRTGLATVAATHEAVGR